jgi:hypothetical protein
MTVHQRSGGGITRIASILRPSHGSGVVRASSAIPCGRCSRCGRRLLARAIAGVEVASANLAARALLRRSRRHCAVLLRSRAHHEGMQSACVGPSVEVVGWVRDRTATTEAQEARAAGLGVLTLIFLEYFPCVPKYIIRGEFRFVERDWIVRRDRLFCF